mmetsp:Transcript_82357/g.142822  ORF Transcript_82357/g.142822 Transcript_82357/m.142822 type:complete len:487 (-) Transcript_82357:76-1536(-)
MSESEDILKDGRLLKKVLVEGDGPFPKNGKRVEVHYETFVQDTGAKADSSWDRQEPFDFILGEGDVLEAWDLGVATMRPGERSEFTAAPDLAFGEDGDGEEIPGDATVRFVIELLSGRKAKSVPSDPPAAEAAKSKSGPSSNADAAAEAQRLNRAVQAKDRGNDLIKESQFGKARAAYEESLMMIQNWRGTELAQLKTRNQLRLSCLMNITLCDLKLEDFNDAIRHASEVLEFDPQNCKALYRRGVAQLSSGNLRESRMDLLDASKLDPKNAEVRGRLEECRQRLAQSNQWHKEAFGGMFGKAPDQHVIERDWSKLQKVWMDFQIGSSEKHRVCIVLYNDNVPRTTENFRSLCRGDRGKGRCGQPLHYQKTCIHKVVPGNLIEGGDIQNYDGTGGESIYGPKFEDENFANTHHKRGLLSMVNKGPDTNNSKFFVTLRSLPQLDGKHVVFGEVVHGMYVLDTVEKVETEFPDKPKVQVAIVDCGEGW